MFESEWRERHEGDQERRRSPAGQCAGIANRNQRDGGDDRRQCRRRRMGMHGKRHRRARPQEPDGPAVLCQANQRVEHEHRARRDHVGVGESHELEAAPARKRQQGTPQQAEPPIEEAAPGGVRQWKLQRRQRRNEQGDRQPRLVHEQRQREHIEPQRSQMERAREHRSVQRERVEFADRQRLRHVARRVVAGGARHAARNGHRHEGGDDEAIAAGRGVRGRRGGSACRAHGGTWHGHRCQARARNTQS